MTSFAADLGSHIIAACQAAQADIAGSLSSALGAGLSAEFSPAARPARELAGALTGPGLLLEFRTRSGTVGLVLPESSGLLPAWYRAPDATGASKLATLAQELSLQALPEDCVAEEFAARAVAELQAELAATLTGAQATALQWTLTAGDQSGLAALLWPLVPAAASTAGPAVAAQPDAAQNAIAGAPPRPGQRRAKQVEDLPQYARSLLRVRVPVCVKLAQRKQPVARILEIAPGAILQFDKSCHELLDLQVGDRNIALGEAVKVGDKFGLRIAQVILPDEQFRPVRKR